MLETIDDADPRIARLQSIDWDFAKEKTTFLTHGLHPYPAKYIPQIPNRLIEELSKPGDRVADVFAGSGTTLVEALTLGRNAVGIDANPIAHLIAKAKTTRLSASDEATLFDLVRQASALGNSISASATPFTSKAPRPDDKAIDFWFEPFVVEELAEALSWCRALVTDASQTVALTAFSAIVVAVSRQDSDTRYVRRPKNIAPGDTLRRFAKSLEDATRAVSCFTASVKPDLTCDVYLANVLDGPDIGAVDLVVCSPPYPNAYSYHLYHMTRMVWLGMDQPGFKRIEIGSHRKYSSYSSRGATVETFRAEMASIFDWLRHHLATDRYACFVVGDSTIRGVRVSNADVLADAAQEYGFREVARLYRRMQDTKKAFNPAIGKIKSEQILILQCLRGR